MSLGLSVSLKSPIRREVQWPCDIIRTCPQVELLFCHRTVSNLHSVTKEKYIIDVNFACYHCLPTTKIW